MNLNLTLNDLTLFSERKKTGSRAKVVSRGWVRRVDRHLTFCSHEYSFVPIILKPDMCKKGSTSKRKGGETPTVELNQQLSRLMRIHCDLLHVSKNNTLHHKISILI